MDATLKKLFAGLKVAEVISDIYVHAFMKKLEEKGSDMEEMKAIWSSIVEDKNLTKGVNLNRGKGRKTNKGKKKLTGYNLFMKENMRAVREDLGNKDAEFGSTSTALATRWRALSDKEKEEYNERAQQLFDALPDSSPPLPESEDITVTSPASNILGPKVQDISGLHPAPKPKEKKLKKDVAITEAKEEPVKKKKKPVAPAVPVVPEIVDKDDLEAWDAIKGMSKKDLLERCKELQITPKTKLDELKIQVYEETVVGFQDD